MIQKSSTKGSAVARFNDPAAREKTHSVRAHTHLMHANLSEIINQKYSKNGRIFLQSKTAVFYVNVC